MLDEEDGNAEGVPDLDDVVHELRGLRGVHARRRLVQQQQAGVGGQGPDDLQLPLVAVGQGARLVLGQIAHVEDGQQLHGPLVGQLLRVPVLGQAEDPRPHIVVDVVVQAQLHVVLHTQVGEQTDVLEGAGDARFVHLDGIHIVRVHPVHQDSSPGGLIHFSQQIEHRSLTRAVGADEAGDLGAADGHVEVLHRRQAAEVDAQVAALQNGALIDVPLRDLIGTGYRDQLDRFLLRPTHCAAPPFFSPLRSRSRAKKPQMAGLLVASITRISTMAYTSIR